MYRVEDKGSANYSHYECIDPSGIVAPLSDLAFFKLFFRNISISQISFAQIGCVESGFTQVGCPLQLHF